MYIYLYASAYADVSVDEWAASECIALHYIVHIWNIYTHILHIHMCAYIVFSAVYYFPVLFNTSHFIFI